VTGVANCQPAMIEIKSYREKSGANGPT